MQLQLLLRLRHTVLWRLLLVKGVGRRALGMLLVLDGLHWVVLLWVRRCWRAIGLLLILRLKRGLSERVISWPRVVRLEVLLLLKVLVLWIRNWGRRSRHYGGILSWVPLSC